METHRRTSLLVFFLGVVAPLAGFGWLAATRHAATSTRTYVALDRVSGNLSFAIIQSGGIDVVVGLAVLGTLILKRKRRLLDAAFLSISVIGSVAGNLVVKLFLSGSQPKDWDRERGFAFGFPSGTAMSTLAVALAFAVLSWETRWRWEIFGMSAIYVAFIGISLARSGESSLAEVMSGWQLSLAWVVTLTCLRDVFTGARTRVADDEQNN